MSDLVLLVRTVGGRCQALSDVAPTGLLARWQKQPREAPPYPASRPLEATGSYPGAGGGTTRRHEPNVETRRPCGR